MEVSDVSVHSPGLREVEQEDEPSPGQEHWSRSAKVCEPASSDLCKQTHGTAGMGESRAEEWGGPVPEHPQLWGSGVKDPGDGAVAQHIWGLV